MVPRWNDWLRTLASTKSAKCPSGSAALICAPPAGTLYISKRNIFACLRSLTPTWPHHTYNTPPPTARGMPHGTASASSPMCRRAARDVE